MITDNFTDVTKLTDRAKKTAGLRLAAYWPPTHSKGLPVERFD